MKSEIYDEVFGLLRLSSQGYYISTVRISSGEVVEVTLEARNAKDEDLPAIIETYRKVYPSVIDRREAFVKAISDEYLAEYNEICGEGDATHEGFRVA